MGACAAVLWRTTSVRNSLACLLAFFFFLWCLYDCAPALLCRCLPVAFAAQSRLSPAQCFFCPTPSAHLWCTPAAQKKKKEQFKNRTPQWNPANTLLVGPATTRRLCRQHTAHVAGRVDGMHDSGKSVARSTTLHFVFCFLGAVLFVCFAGPAAELLPLLLFLLLAFCACAPVRVNSYSDGGKHISRKLRHAPWLYSCL